MSSGFRVAIVSVLAWLLLAGAAHAVNFPSVPIPDGASGEVVTQHMIYNGINMRASLFTVQQPLAEVKAFYKKEWGKAMVETPRGSKVVLGHMEGKYFVTIELTPSGAMTRGQVGISQVPEGKTTPPPGKGFARLPKTRMLEDITYMDTPEHARTLTMRNTYSPYQNDRFYARDFAGKGYARDAGAKPCTASSARCISYFVKGDRKVVLATIRDDHGTQLAAIVR